MHVLKTLKQFAFAALAFVLTLAPLAAAQAQDAKPVVVVSLASVDKIKADILYLAELVGRKDETELALNFGSVYLSGVDLKRPAGAYLTISGAGEPKFIGFVPVTKLDTLLSIYKERLNPSDAGDGVKQVEYPGGEAYIKESKGWAFISNEKENLASLPADPVAMLGKLPTMYNFAIQANVHDIPQELRQIAVDQIQSGFERGLEDAPDRELAEKLGRMSSRQITQAIEELKSFTIGWGVDKTLKATYLDVEMTAVDGTAMARQMALLKDATSGFAGFLLPTSALNFNGITRMSPEEIEQNTTLLDVFRERANKEIDNDAGLDASQRKLAKDLVGDFFAVLVDTVKGGKMDYGATLMLDEKKLNFAGGILVADGKKLETAFTKLVALAKDEPDFPDVKLNAAKHGNVNLHTITVDLPDSADEDARELFGGDQVNIVIGTAPKALYVAFGKDGVSLLKQTIDASATKTQQAVPPGQVNVYLKPIMKFVASMDKSGNPGISEAVKAFSKAKAGEDEINIVTKPVAGGALSRLQVNEGVLKLIGEAAKAAEGK